MNSAHLAFFSFYDGMGGERVVQDTATPGRIRESYEYYRKAREEEARRVRETPASSDQLDEYTEKARKITAAIEKLRAETVKARAETAELQSSIARLEEGKRNARRIADSRNALMLKEQQMLLASVQEAALLEELQVIDIAYVSIIALGAILQ